MSYFARMSDTNIKIDNVHNEKYHDEHFPVIKCKGGKV